MPAIHLDWTLNIGHVILAGLLTAIGWGLRKGYYASREWVQRQNANERDLHTGLQMIDTHSWIIRKNGLTTTPLPRVYQRRREEDHMPDILIDPPDHVQRPT